MLRVAIASLCLATTLTFPALAQSQEDQAAALDQGARTAFADGDFKRAAELFEEANRLSPHAQLRYNAALAWEKAGEKARAADGYEAALRQGGLDDQRAGKARAGLAALKQTLGYVKMPGPLGGTLSVAHQNSAPIPAQFHLTPGTHVIAVQRADGSSTSKSIQVRAGEVVSVEIEAGVASLRAPAAAPATREVPPAKDTPATTTSFFPSYVGLDCPWWRRAAGWRHGILWHSDSLSERRLRSVQVHRRRCPRPRSAQPIDHERSPGRRSRCRRRRELLAHHEPQVRLRGARAPPTR